MIIPNATNGLPLVNAPWPHVLYFQSCHGEHLKTHYMDEGSVPLSFIIELLTIREPITILDGTSSGKIPRSYKCGFLTFCMVWERARIGKNKFIKKEWKSDYNSRDSCIQASFFHGRIVGKIRKMAHRIGRVRPILVTDQDGKVAFSSNDDKEIVRIHLNWEKVSYDDDYIEIRKLLWPQDT